MRGIQAERNLVRQLWKKGFAVMRAPSSGSSTKMDRPDIIAGNKIKGLQFAIEVKTTVKECLYIKEKSIKQLVEFSQRFGCQSILAIKFKGRRRNWIFIKPDQLSFTPSLNYKITFRNALRLGIDFKTLIKEGKQTKIYH
jgi:Holliday junction resolvase